MGDFECGLRRGGGTRVRAEIAMRVVIAEDSVLLREGLGAPPRPTTGFEVVAQCGDTPRT